MAPTICTEKKNQIRGVKKTRRHSHSSQMLLSTSSSSTSSIPSALNYVTTNTNNTRSIRLRSTSTSINSSPVERVSRNMNKIFYDFSPQQQHQQQQQMTTTGTIIDSEISLQSTYEFSAPSPSSCCIDERLSPYSFYHDDDNFNSIDSEFNQAYITTSSFKGNSSNDSNITSSLPTLYDCHEKYDSINNCDNDFEQLNFPISLTQLSEVRNTAGLFEIALKTIKLIERNQMLQKRLAQLQHETSEFIESVLANPENRAFRENMQRQNGTEAI